MTYFESQRNRYPYLGSCPYILYYSINQVQPKLPENFEDNTWDKLQQAVAAVQGKRPIATSREELYRAVEDLCVHKMGSRLYDR